MTLVRELAPAKINLFLHVGGLRPDRLHDLASLFVFAGVGDIIEAKPAEALSLSVTGPFAPALAPFPVADNLVLKAAKALQAEAGIDAGAAIILDKRLPVAAGIGGGSADAAAALRALSRLWRLDIPRTRMNEIAFSLGADIPACLAERPVRVSGAGERLAPGPALPPLWVALVNPRVETPTGPIFRAFDGANPAPPAPVDPVPTQLSGYGAIADLMAASRNDLEPPAVALVPLVGAATAFLGRQPGAMAARMSGSGATAFALFASPEGAARAARAATARGWWAASAKLL